MNKKGFTLVEVLVSLALVSTIAIFLFQIIFIIRDIYAEKNIKSEIYIESSNISNVINKDIFNKDKNGIYIKTINKVSNDEMYITYSDGTKNNIVIDRNNHTITYGNYTVSILDVAKIGNIELYYNYETVDTEKNGICYIKIPITHDDYKNDFGVVITYRYDSSKTRINGDITITPGSSNKCSYDLGKSWNFDYTGDVQDFTVPCDGTYKIEAWGAQGGNVSATYYGGKGGYSSGHLQSQKDQKLYIYVGGSGAFCSGLDCKIAGGYNGGGSGTAYNACGGELSVASGGGATHIATIAGLLSTLSSNVSSVIIVAGGGGGGNYCNSSNYAAGGYGGGVAGGNAVDLGAPHFSANGGANAIGGTQSGLTFGQGGSCSTGCVGGGGGYYGGKSSGLNGAGGGSGYIGGITNGTTIAGNELMPTHDGISTMTGNTGNGYAKITLVSYN
nr:prepilin-type N-terminal cleavage/methylation domain-containing protein [Bacilli bacterium]